MSLDQQVHLRQHIRRAKNGVCPGGAINPKLATTVQGSVYERHIVAQKVARHRDTPNFCVRVIFDIYQQVRSRQWSEYKNNLLQLKVCIGRLHIEKFDQPFWTLGWTVLIRTYSRLAGLLEI